MLGQLVQLLRGKRKRSPVYGKHFQVVPSSLPVDSLDTFAFKLLHDDVSEAQWTGKLLVHSPTFRQSYKSGFMPLLDIDMDSDLIRNLAIEGVTGSSLHDEIQAAIREYSDMKRNRSSASISSRCGSRSRTSLASAQQFCPSAPSESQSPGNRDAGKTGIRRPDLSLHYDTHVNGVMYRGSALEIEFTVFSHQPVPPLGAPHQPMPEFDDDSDGHHALQAARVLNYSRSDVWIRGLTQAMIYLCISNELSGTRLGALVASECMQRLVQLEVDGKAVIAIEFASKLPIPHPHILPLADLLQRPMSERLPWSFARRNSDTISADPDTLRAWAQLFTAAYSFVKDVRFDEPLRRIEAGSIDTHPFVVELLRRAHGSNLEMQAECMKSVVEERPTLKALGRANKKSETRTEAPPAGTRSQASVHTSSPFGAPRSANVAGERDVATSTRLQGPVSGDISSDSESDDSPVKRPRVTPPRRPTHGSSQRTPPSPSGKGAPAGRRRSARIASQQEGRITSRSQSGETSKLSGSSSRSNSNPRSPEPVALANLLAVQVAQSAVSDTVIGLDTVATPDLSDPEVETSPDTSFGHHSYPVPDSGDEQPSQMSDMDWDTDSEADDEPNPWGSWTRRQTDKFLFSMTNQEVITFVSQLPLPPLLIVSPAEMCRLVAIVGGSS